MTDWLLLRGLGRESGHWGGFARRLGRQLGPGHRVHALDLPGTGRFHLGASPWTVPGIVQACRREAPAGSPRVLVALSLGAMVAAEWARRETGEVAGCVLINTSGAGLAAPWERLQAAQAKALARLLLPGLAPAERERRVLGLTSADPGSRLQALRTWTVIARRRPVRRGTVLRQLLAASLWPALPAPPTPVLLLASAGDRLVAPDCSQRIARAWQAPLQIHPTAGHDLPLDDPDWVAREIAAWWRARLA